MTRRRPKNLKLTSIRLPLPALISILHRISGALLFLVIPLLLWLWQQSLASVEGYVATLQLLHHPIPKLLMLVLIWAFMHHACAGLRHLVLDTHWGHRFSFARASSAGVLFIGGLLTVIAGVWLW
jgi:succinate dehydrogenase / fumarate reductase, cytochrome b subunit